MFGQKCCHACIPCNSSGTRVSIKRQGCSGPQCDFLVKAIQEHPATRLFFQVLGWEKWRSIEQWSMAVSGAIWRCSPCWNCRVLGGKSMHQEAVRVEGGKGSQGLGVSLTHWNSWCFHGSISPSHSGRWKKVWRPTPLRS